MSYSKFAKNRMSISLDAIPHLLFFFLFFFLMPSARAQVQLDVQGSVESDDTIARIRVNSNAMFTDVIGLHVFSHPAPGRGIGGSFYGGSIGLWAEGRQTAIFGKSKNNWGIRAESEFGSAGYFESGPGKMDIVLGGSAYGDGSGSDEGVIGISASKPSGDLYLVSNDALVIQLDQNDDENGHLIIKNGDQEDVMNINESGYISFRDGTLQTSAPYQTRYETINVGTDHTYNLTTANLWVPLGDLITINKDRDDTHLEITFDGFGRGVPASIGSVVEFAIRVDGSWGDIAFTHKKIGTSNTTIEMELKSIFSSLSAGTHSIQIYAQTYGELPAVGVRINGTTQRVLIKELF